MPAIAALSAIALAHSWSASGCISFVKDCGAVPDDKTDSGSAFVRCQALAPPPHGPGCVFVPAGNYTTSGTATGVYLNASHIQYRFEDGARIRPWPGLTENASLLALTPVKRSTDVPKVRNVSLVGIQGGRWTLDVSVGMWPTWKMVALAFSGDVADFAVANLDIRLADPNADPGARYASVMPGMNFNYVADAQGARHHPTDASIHNLTSTGGVWGYGAVQVRSAERLTFENLDGTGGVALRLESGGGGLEYVADIVGRDIVCRNGHAAFMAEPHTQKNGLFSISNVTSFGCGLTAEVNGGYSQNGLPPGWFANGSSVRGMQGYYHPTGHAQLNHTVPNGSPCTVCGNENAVINYDVRLESITPRGFPPAPPGLPPRTQCSHWIRWQGCPYQH